jgi:hypothetical protein
MEPHLCQLDAAGGGSEPCPGETCPFWKDDRCTVAPLRADLRVTLAWSRTSSGFGGRLLGRSRPTCRHFHPPGLA